MQAEEHQDVIRADAAGDAVGAEYMHALESAVVGVELAHGAGEHIGASLLLEGAELGHGGMRAAKLGAAVHQHHAARLVGERHRPVERRVAAAADHEVAVLESAGIADPVVQGATLEFRRPRRVQAPRLKRADAAGNDHHAGIEQRAGGRPHEETAR